MKKDIRRSSMGASESTRQGKQKTVRVFEKYVETVSNTEGAGGEFMKCNILGVPIMKCGDRELPRGETGRYFMSFDEKWMREALREFKNWKSDGYLPPVYIDRPGIERKQVGFFALTKIRKDDGEITLFADFVSLTPDAYGSIKKGELSHRSVNIIELRTVESIYLSQK